jgi:hypothetical protein
MSQESRSLDVFGPNLLLESGGAVGVSGAIAYQLCSVNENGFRYSQGLYGSGLARIHNEGTLQIEAGIKNSGEESSTLLLAAHKGHVDVVANEGWVKIKGQNIVLEAAEELVLQANNIRIGYQDRRTEEIKFNARHIDMGTPTGGNMADLLKTSSMFKIFTGLPGVDGIIAAAAGKVSGGISFK